MSAMNVGGVVFGRKNLPKTALIIVFVATFIRLGFWQLDRLEWRRNLNETLATQLAQPPVSLNSLTDYDELLDMTDRKITVRGTFDFSEQIILKNRNNETTGAGVHLVAPYVLEGTDQAVLVDRGWIALAEQGEPFEEQLSEIAGVVQQSEKLPRSATGEESGGTEVFRINIPVLQEQSDYELLPIFVLQTGDSAEINARPYRTEYNVSLSEGSHLGYAIQWFSFALIFGVGYFFYLRRNP